MEAPCTAMSQLNQVCASKNWSSPSYVLCREEGASHQKMFTYKVIVEVETICSTLLECYSSPKPQQIAAQEHAAEGALWYLKHLGYLS